MTSLFLFAKDVVFSKRLSTHLRLEVIGGFCCLFNASFRTRKGIAPPISNGETISHFYMFTLVCITFHNGFEILRGRRGRDIMVVGLTYLFNRCISPLTL